MHLYSNFVESLASIKKEKYINIFILISYCCKCLSSNNDKDNDHSKKILIFLRIKNINIYYQFVKFTVKVPETDGAIKCKVRRKCLIRWSGIYKINFMDSISCFELKELIGHSIKMIRF